jgi:hypothetical protein
MGVCYQVLYGCADKRPMTTTTPKPRVVRLPAQYRVPAEKLAKDWTGDDIAAKVNGNPFGPYADVMEVTRLMGDSAANGDKNDPIVVSGQTELVLRRLTAKFGFERLPLTYGELHGFLDYALHLQGASTEDIAQHPTQAATWRQSVLEICREYFPERLEALELYLAGNLAGLLAHHRAQDTMYRLGQAYREEIDD